MTKQKTGQYRKRGAYLIGIKGVGMTALAKLLKARGYVVSGSDTHEQFFTDAVLKRHGIRVHEGFDARRVAKLATPNPKPQTLSPLIVASSAYDTTNLEIAEAERCGFKVFTYAEMLGMLFNEKEGIAVCGSHGKTTTSALRGYVFYKAGLHPTVVVGSEVPQFHGNALAGSGRHFIAEVDEYQNKFRYLKPKAILLTNVDYDHPDFFKTRVAYRAAFRNFVKRLPRNGVSVACSDDWEVRGILPNVRAKTVLYGLDDVRSALSHSMELESAWLARDVYVRRGRWYFTAHKNGKKFGTFTLKLPGKHNVLNALGVIALADAYGISKRVLQNAIASFRGTRRRFERIGVYHGALLIDDYAHHPTEIRATLKAARELFPRKRIVAVFHPHTYSRTKALLGDFARAFEWADEVIVLDVYSSARESRGSVTSRDIVLQAKKYHKNIRHIPIILAAVRYLKKHLKKNDVLITLGAGDVWKVANGLRERRERR